MASRGQVHLRFEDIVQDGRVRLNALGASVGIVWREEIAGHPLYAFCREQGILPLSTRFVFEGFSGPFAVENPIEATGHFALGRTVDAKGATNRLLLDIVTELEAPLGRTTVPPPENAGLVVKAGRVLAQHVFTRPFAEAKDRRVVDLGEHSLNLPVVAWPEPNALLRPPPGARVIRPLELELHDVVFGATHTDSNQHVNSLVYPVLFEELAVHHLGQPGALARTLDIRFRKPSFAGDRLQVALSLWELEGRLHASGVFLEHGGDPEHGRVFVELTFEQA